ncbi:MAG: nitrate reductase molybdenum cofactor assembly chaperone [Sphingomonadales bacterium]|nr:nitrate reductase molybdenum cofactor assembly chaperone [Sphingomonadales bacterium]
MSSSIKILSLLLSYPTYEQQQAIGELETALKEEKLLSEENLKALDALFADFKGQNLLDCQENYVHLFDRTRALSLNLFEHIHGESRDRGQAMVNLKTEYEKHGLEMDSQELPDYLPIFLEFISILPEEEAQDYLRQVLPIITAIEVRLDKRKSSYKGIFQVLISLADEVADEKQLSELLAVELDDPDDKEAIDKLWEETEVKFGPSSNPNDECPVARENLAHMTSLKENLNSETKIKEDSHG